MRAHPSHVLELVFDGGGLDGELTGTCIGSGGHSEVDRCHMI